MVGDIGTFAGLVTDERTRVLNASGEPIKGLYAVGNDAASIMGGNYPGAGITLGPALTFGFIAGNQVGAGRRPRRPTSQRDRSLDDRPTRRLTQSTYVFGAKLMSTPSLNSPKLLDGRLALITGAGQGNGRALALGLAAAGARVVVTDVNPATVAETARLVREQGGTAVAETLDVTSSEACKGLADPPRT